MSCSKPLPTYELLCYLNRDQLERFSIVCRPLKNIIDRYFHSKPYRIFDRLWIEAGSYALRHNNVFWHPNRDGYSAQQFLAAQNSNMGPTFYSIAEMRPYLGPTVRIKEATIYVDTYNLGHIAEMESIAYLWSEGNIFIQPVSFKQRIIAEDFQPILNSPIILKCRKLEMDNAHFSFKDYKVFYSVEVIKLDYFADVQIDLSHWQQFLEQPGVKPVIALHYVDSESIINLTDRLKEAFPSAVSPNAFKILFVECQEPLTEFRVMNQTTSEILELKKGLPVEYQEEGLEKYDNYTLE